MHRMRFLTGPKNSNAAVAVPDGQITFLWVVAGDPGTWIQINNCGPIWIPKDHHLKMSAADLGNCCGVDTCDRFPGDVQVQVVIGQNVQRAPDSNPDAPDAGAAPVTWLIAYNGRF